MVHLNLSATYSLSVRRPRRAILFGGGAFCLQISPRRVLASAEPNHLEIKRLLVFADNFLQPCFIRTLNGDSRREWIDSVYDIPT